MIGNDVVSFSLAKKESDWRRPNYLNKIFTVDEQRYILNAENLDVALWTLWSAKEAVYKIVNRNTGIRLFNPVRFACSLAGEHKYKVIFEDKDFLVKSRLTATFVHSIALADESSFNNYIELQRHQIIKVNSLPFYRAAENQLRCASVSHHGDYYFAVGLKS